MKNLLKKIWQIKIARLFIVYLPLAGIATLVDWGSYYLFYSRLNIHYGLSVFISYTLGGVTNYTLNKFFNFRDSVKKIGLQMFVYALIMCISYILNHIFMFVQIELIGLKGMAARILTTGIVLIYNFLMHRFFTFNEVFEQKLAALFKSGK